MAKYVIIFLLINILTTSALEDPDLINNCGNTKALALGLSPSTDRGSQIIPTGSTYEIPLTPTLPQFTSYDKPQLIIKAPHQIGIVYPSTKQSNKNYASNEDISFASAKNNIKFVKSIKPIKNDDPIFKYVQLPAKTFDFPSYSDEIKISTLQSSSSSFSNVGAENLHRSPALSTYDASSFDGPIKQNIAAAHSNFHAPIIAKLNTEFLALQNSENTSYTSTSDRNSSSASSYISVSSPSIINTIASSAKPNIQNLPNQLQPNTQNYLNAVFVPAINHDQNLILKEFSNPYVSKSYIRVMSGGLGQHYSTSTGVQSDKKPKYQTSVLPSVRAVEMKKEHGEDQYYDAHPHYMFEYSVHDVQTADVKEQKEQREGDVVTGHYSLLQPDGHIRTVIYSADWKNGFDAKVTYSKKQ